MSTPSVLLATAPALPRPNETSGKALRSSTPTVGGGRLRVAHREPEPDAAWPTPRPLEGSANNLLEVRDSDATESGGRDLIAGSAGAV